MTLRVITEGQAATLFASNRMLLAKAPPDWEVMACWRAPGGWHLTLDATWDGEPVWAVEAP